MAVEKNGQGSKLSHCQVDFLLTGDMELEAENALLDAGYDLSAEILKVAHHGSQTSSQGLFLDAVAPEVGIISVGQENGYGHPGRPGLDRLGDRGVDVYRTDWHGTVVVRSTCVSYTVESEFVHGWDVWLPVVTAGAQDVWLPVVAAAFSWE